jgi:hypothetical protein
MDLKSRTLHIWVPGCEEDSIRTYPVSNNSLFGKVRVGDVVTATISDNAQVLEEIKVLSPNERALGFLLLCRGSGGEGQR